MNSSFIAHLLTRREVLGAGLTIASLSSVIGLTAASEVHVVQDQTGMPQIGAIVLDGQLGISTKWVAVFNRAKATLPCLTVGLDSSTASGLKPVFSSAKVIAGISSGAALFCLERMAWDHGYRVTRRSEHAFNANAFDANDNDATLRTLAHAIITNKPESFAAVITAGNRAYRPSMTDDTLHAWIMQTTVTSKTRTV